MSSCRVRGRASGPLMAVVGAHVPSFIKRVLHPCRNVILRQDDIFFCLRVLPHKWHLMTLLFLFKGSNSTCVDRGYITLCCSQLGRSDQLLRAAKTLLWECRSEARHWYLLYNDMDVDTLKGCQIPHPIRGCGWDDGGPFCWLTFRHERVSSEEDPNTLSMGPIWAVLSDTLLVYLNHNVGFSVTTASL